MSDNGVVTLKQLFKELNETLIEEYTSEISYVIREIKGILDTLDNCGDILSIEVKDHIKSSYQSFFPNHGGLTDFFIWRESFNDRKELNSSFNKLKEKLWKELG